MSFSSVNLPSHCDLRFRKKTQTEQLAHFRLFFLQPNTLPTEGLHVYILLLYSTQASNLTTKHGVFLGHVNSLSMRRKWVTSQLHSLYKQKLPIFLYSLDHNLVLSLCCILRTGRSNYLFIRQNSESHHFNIKDNNLLLLTKHWQEVLLNNGNTEWKLFLYCSFWVLN